MCLQIRTDNMHKHLYIFQNILLELGLRSDIYVYGYIFATLKYTVTIPRQGDAALRQRRHHRQDRPPPKLPSGPLSHFHSQD